jgi:8-oxo-dGTP pyrophosphatase MutT (NUDIX family)
MKDPWTILSQKPVYDNQWISVTEFQVLNPKGGNGIYGKVHFKNRAVGILAMDEERNIYLVGQYRFVLGQYSWEIPEGGAAEGEGLLDAARRELKEETGLHAEHWEKLFDMHLSNSVTDETAQVFLATGLVQAGSQPEDTEDISVRKLALDKAYEMVLGGEITDSMSVAAIFRLKLLLQERNYDREK